MIKLKHCLFILSLFLFHALYAVPADSLSNPKDTVQKEILLQQSQQLKELEVVRIADSIKKVELEKQISSLQANDSLRRVELQKELEKTKARDTEMRAEKRHTIDSLRNVVKGFAVVPFLDDTVFTIFSKLGSFSAAERANAVLLRIQKLKDNYAFKRDSLQIIPAEQTTDLVFGDLIVASISDNDALWENTTKEKLAPIYKKRIEDAVMQYRQATSWQTILKEIGLALLVLLVLGFIIYLLLKFFRYTTTKIEAQKGKRIRGIKIRSYELLDASHQLDFFLRINTFIKWLLVLISVYMALPILFSIFPWTKNFAEVLLGYFIAPLKKICISVWDYLPNLFTVIIIVVIFQYVLKGINFLRSEIESGSLRLPGFYADWANPTYQIIRVLVYAFMLVVIFPYLPGSDSPVFKGVSVFLGVLFTFGSSGSLSNVVAGLVLTYMRAFRIGDRVKIGDITGDVIDKSMLVTRVRTIKNEIISIPNSNVMSSHTINYSSEAAINGLIVHTTVTIGYDVPWKDMHKALLDAAGKTEFILESPEPFVLQTSLDDFYVSYQINGYTREPNKQATIYSDLHQNIQDICNEMGIEIMSPHYTAARDGNMTTIPAGYLPKDYKAPGFTVDIKKEKE